MDADTNDWVLKYRETYTYDENRNKTEENEYRWDKDTDDWIIYTKTVLYWSELTTSISNNIIDLNYIVYPNPTNDRITIETDRFDHYSINITSQNGQLIFHAEMDGPTHQIDLSSFQKGLYFITLRSKDYVRTEKIIKL